ncbi:MAG: alpha/beta hydrolase [Candidatus Eisenbacteria bacterium]|nr:alpha/beta hydrolase [Candidatus Eisenbacteria bacterium]
MAYLDLKDGAKIYYEVHGEGESVIFLNGIMMNTMSWLPFIPELSKRFKLILVDFRDQGQSSKLQEGYGPDIHVRDVVSLLDELDIPMVHMMGVSYGGGVALHFALKHQKRIKSFCLFNTPNRVTNHLREIGTAWETAAELNDGERFFQLAVPFIYSEPFYETHLDFLIERQKIFKSLLTKEWFEGFIRLSRSFKNYFISPEELKTIKVPTLLVRADLDIIASGRAMKDIHENIPNCELITIPEAGHAAFLEKMNEFLTILIGFVTKHS